MQLMHIEAIVGSNKLCNVDPSQSRHGEHVDPSLLAYDSENEILCSPPYPTSSLIALVDVSPAATPAVTRK